MTPSSEIERQIEAAYDFRGHASITFKDGRTLVAYIFNREYANPRAAEQHWIEVIPKDSEERLRIPIAELAKVELTGKDYAAGNSFEDYLKKKAAEQP
ncbi:MAG: hypothetical protein HY553_01885 [Elusimicrobia bacterium]|nr:hypothetical protein [Elusimicrobiota bacterium]